MRRIPVIFALLLLASAAPPSAVRRQGRRAEAQAAVARILSGAGTQAAVARLRYLGEEEHAVELLAAEVRSADERVRREVAAALAFLDTPHAEPLLVLLASDPDTAVRMSAAQGLGHIQSRRVDVLRPLLADESSGVRREAGRALGKSREEKVGALLMEAAWAEPEVEVRAVLLAAVGEAGDGRQVKALTPFLRSSSESTRFAAAQGLCRLGAKEGFAFAGKLLASEDRFVRRQGLALYEGTSAARARPALGPLLQGGDLRLAATAARVLYQGGAPEMLDWLVLRSWRAKGEDKLIYEAELEALRLPDDQRKAILRRAKVVSAADP